MNIIFRQVLQNLKENKKIANATHNMYAYRILKEDTQSFLQDCEDDGETHAGSRILHLLNVCKYVFITSYTIHVHYIYVPSGTII